MNSGKNNYIMFDDLMEKLETRKFNEIIEKKILLLEDIKVVKSRYLQYLMMRKSQKHILKIYLNLTNRCNSNCVYCFAHANREGRDMQFDTVISTLSKLIQNVEEETTICFFGGEPTLKFELIKEIVKYVQMKFSNKKISFTMVTNGIDLSYDKLQFIKEKFSSLTFSIDGNYNYMLNNRIRNNELVERVFVNVRKACEELDNVSIRATITEQTQNIVDTYLFLKSFGAKKIRFKPVSCCGNETYAIKDWNYVIKESERLSKIVMKDIIDGTVFQVFPYSMYLYQFEKRFSKITGCAMNIVTISQEGEVYPCYRFVDNNDFLINERTMFTKLPLNYVDNKEKCSNCWCKYICGGGCYADSFMYGDGIEMAYSSQCDYIKNTIMQSIEMYKYITSR